MKIIEAVNLFYRSTKEEVLERLSTKWRIIESIYNRSYDITNTYYLVDPNMKKVIGYVEINTMFSLVFVVVPIEYKKDIESVLAGLRKISEERTHFDDEYFELVWRLHQKRIEEVLNKT